MYTYIYIYIYSHVYDTKTLVKQTKQDKLLRYK